MRDLLDVRTSSCLGPVLAVLLYAICRGDGQGYQQFMQKPAEYLPEPDSRSKPKTDENLLGWPRRFRAASGWHEEEEGREWHKVSLTTPRTPLHIAVNDVLLLIRELVRYGKLCDLAHHAAETLDEDLSERAIDDPTFEVSAAVVRLTLAMSTCETQNLA
ncbi:hypothetical protein B0T25DRAFT_571581 [Lasiosphaeria hispida]|uniref:Uncharacterized protein n=1 Tax=Lasiosphaeria hispida TaxID=260671 RepID=A0AAJ0MAQ3_9PEZI|nr:hypothetical protein B0T25DRAFT_571581 [Lasiosphaeria hispida]